MKHAFSTITQLTDEDTEEYILGTLLENPFDDDTREFILGKIKEAMLNACVICDCLFALVDVSRNNKRNNKIG